MSKPLSEPSQRKHDANRDWKISQLDRRPAMGGATGDFLHWGTNTDTDFLGLILDTNFADIETTSANYQLSTGNLNVDVDNSVDIDTGTFTVHNSTSIGLRADGGATATTVSMTEEDVSVQANAGSILLSSGADSAGGTCEVALNVGDNGQASILGWDTVGMATLSDGDDAMQLIISSVGAGQKLDVWIHRVAPLSPMFLFRIDPDGQLHGKTGKSLVFDL